MVALLFVSCKSDAVDDSTPTCEAIMERCHALDTGSGPIHECHEFAEAAGRTEAECQAESTSCFSLCVASVVDAGVTADAHVEEHADAETEHLHDDDGGHAH